MTDQVSFSIWKRIALRAFFGSLGIAAAATLIFGAAVWYHNRPVPWNRRAITATYETLLMSLNSEKKYYVAEFIYSLKNNTNETYKMYSFDLKPMAVLSEGNAISVDFSDRQEGLVELSFPPPLIPPGGTARATVAVEYRYPEHFSAADKLDGPKLTTQFDTC
jgi:hypothetical protein